VVANFVQYVSKCQEVDRPLGWLAKESHGDRLGEWNPFRFHSLPQLVIDTLEAEVGYSGVVAAHEGYRVSPAIGMVTGIEANGNQIRVCVLKKRFDLILILYVRLGVGMINNSKSVLLAGHCRHAMDRFDVPLPTV
jgi:hypothetical protein